MYIWYGLNIYELSYSESYLNSSFLVEVCGGGRHRVDCLGFCFVLLFFFLLYPALISRELCIGCFSHFANLTVVLSVVWSIPNLIQRL